MYKMFIMVAGSKWNVIGNLLTKLHWCVRLSEAAHSLCRIYYMKPVMYWTQETCSLFYDMFEHSYHQIELYI